MTLRYVAPMSGSPGEDVQRGSGTNDGLSAGAPMSMATLRRVYEAGDTVRCLPGVYKTSDDLLSFTGLDRRHGPVTFEGTTLGSVIMDGETEHQTAYRLPEHVSLRNLVMLNSAGSVLLFEGEGLEVDLCIFGNRARWDKPYANQHTIGLSSASHCSLRRFAVFGDTDRKLIQVFAPAGEPPSHHITFENFWARYDSSYRRDPKASGSMASVLSPVYRACDVLVRDAVLLVGRGGDPDVYPTIAEADYQPGVQLLSTDTSVMQPQATHLDVERVMLIAPADSPIQAQGIRIMDDPRRQNLDSRYRQVHISQVIGRMATGKLLKCWTAEGAPTGNTIKRVWNEMDIPVDVSHDWNVTEAFNGQEASPSDEPTLPLALALPLRRAIARCDWLQPEVDELEVFCV